MTNLTPEMRDGLDQAAAALGMPVEWLTTIASYETGGTMNPSQAGPQTRWGQHRGLLQWGEPQAMQYGVDWSDPIGSQLGSDGAVVRYFRDRGWQDDMSFADAYSIVNAGSPARYSAVDGSTTVMQKVESMGDHMQSAMRMLGVEMTGDEQNAYISAQLGGTAAPSSNVQLSAAATDSAASGQGVSNTPPPMPETETARPAPPEWRDAQFADVRLTGDYLSDPQRQGAFAQLVNRG